MPNNDFEFKGYVYSQDRNGKFYRGKWYGAISSFVKDEISEKAYQKAYKSVFRSNVEPAKNKTTRTTYSLNEKWKKQLWSKSSFESYPWNNSGRQLDQRYRALTIDNKNPLFSRVEYGDGKKTGVKDKWGAVGKRKNGKPKAFVLNGIKEWLRHLQIARYQLSKQAENFRVVVGQRALRVFQLSFKYHKFYNENTKWQALSSFTRRKRQISGTWFGKQKSKLFESGELSRSLSNLNSSGELISSVTTGKVRTNKMRISVYDVIRGVRTKDLGTYSFEGVYAGIHNEGVPKGRKPGGKIPKRQFMGWSNFRNGRMDKIDTFAYQIADSYLFDSVFMSKQSV